MTQQMIEGQMTTVVEKTPPLPQRLDALLAGMFQIFYRDEGIRPKGARAQCEQRQHTMRRLREGRYVCSDGIVRDLRVELCIYCEAACVRDISFQRLDEMDGGHPSDRALHGRGGPVRRNRIIGWYSGKRRAGREYR